MIQRVPILSKNRPEWHNFHNLETLAEDGIRDVERSRGLGDVYKRQVEIVPLGSVLGEDGRTLDHLILM